MARSRLLTVAFIATPFVLLTLVGYGIILVFGNKAASGSPIEVVGGSIHVVANPKVPWTKGVDDMHYIATLPAGYSVSQIFTDGVKTGVTSPIGVQGAWKVELSNPNYSQAVSICSDPGCSLSTTSAPGQQVYVVLSSANLIWELIGKSGGAAELHFHDKACDKNYPASRNEGRCDFLSTVTISDSTFNSTHQPLASGRCARVPILLEGYCNVQIGAPIP